jgi:2,4-dienoyl-CoA reductase-like NADH-dependent reductase (Old Yellow Enzyme family)
MTKSDIASLRRWHRDAVLRSLAVGYDLVYVYAGHALSGIHYFLSSRYNSRTDEYGGSVRNRARLLREILADAREAAAGKAAVACRITVDELLGDDGITRAAGAITGCVLTGEQETAEAHAVVLVTARLPADELYAELQTRAPEWADSGITSVTAIGDAWAPATIAAAVWSGRRYAEELDAPAPDGPVPFRRELTALVPAPSSKPRTGTRT